MTVTKPPQAPPNLGPSRTFWRKIVAEYELEVADLRLLEAACRSWDRAQEARATLEREGLIFHDRFGQPRARPEVAVERDAKAQFEKFVRALRLDGDESAPTPNRLPSPRGR